MSGKNKNEARAEAPDAATNGADVGKFPLFYTNPHVITLNRHGQAQMRSDITLAFARDTNSIPLTLADFGEAAKYYPIAFTHGETVIPVAIVGMEQKNYFVDSQGKWLNSCYVPSYVRKYPFIFTENPATKELTLCIDEITVEFDAKTKGVKLFEDGKPTAFANNALEFCTAYQEQYRFTQEFCDLLKKKDLLVPQRSDVELGKGRSIQLTGFQLIDAEKIKALPEKDVIEWHRRGYLALIYYVLQSNSNWRNLLELANEQEAKTKNGKQA